MWKWHLPMSTRWPSWTEEELIPRVSAGSRARGPQLPLQGLFLKHRHLCVQDGMDLITFKAVISPFQNGASCAVLNLDSRNTHTGRPCVHKFIARVPVYAREAHGEVPGCGSGFWRSLTELLALTGFGCKNYPATDLFLNFNSSFSTWIISMFPKQK